nr:MAG TPA_asm: hypothetical protein [Caudoviricetes sp.]
MPLSVIFPSVCSGWRAIYHRITARRAFFRHLTA